MVIIRARARDYLCLRHQQWLRGIHRPSLAALPEVTDSQRRHDRRTGNVADADIAHIHRQARDITGQWLATGWQPALTERWHDRHRRLSATLPGPEAVLADVITHPEMLAVARLLITSQRTPGTRPGDIASRLGFPYPSRPHPLDPLQNYLSQLVNLTRLCGVSATVTLEPWGSGDLPLLERLMGDPRMTEHLGGPESPDKLRERQGRYERLEGGDRMFKIVDVASGASVGSAGFWTKEWRDEQAYEIGWMVVPEFQGRGIAVAATAQAIELARRDGKHRFMHAFPNVDNAPSNAICRKLGFELLKACEFEFPKGHFMTCNDWRLDLRA